MPESDSQFPQIRLAPLLGLNQRTAANSTPNGEWETLDGLYPDQYGQLSRIPGKQLYTTIPGNPTVLSIVQTNDGSGNILVQTSQDLRAYTLDELLGRAVAPNITPTPLTDDESMPQAILEQREPNNSPGGSIDGFVAANSTAAVVNTFYQQRLTTLLTNESTIVISNSLALAGTNGATGNWTLAPGTYRIRALKTFLCGTNGAATIIMGLFNSTSNSFEVYNTGSGGTIPIQANAVRISSGPTNTTFQAFIDATFFIGGGAGNQTYYLAAEAAGANNTNTQADIRNKTFGGTVDNVTGTVNAAAPVSVYTRVVLNKIA